MQIADLFDANTREQAVQELPDSDLLVACVLKTQDPFKDAVLRERLALDVAWLAMHARSEATAVAIVRQGASVLPSALVFEAFATVLCYQTAVTSRSARLRGGASTSGTAEHIVQHPHGRAVLAELGRREAQRLAEGPQIVNVRFIQEMLSYIDDVAHLERIAQFRGLISQKLVVARIWELGYTDVVERLADADSASPVSRAARMAAERMLGLDHVV